MSMKAFDITKDELKILEVSANNTDLENEAYYLETLNNEEWGYNRALSQFVFKIDDQIYYGKLQLIPTMQYRCCGQSPAEIIGCVLEKDTNENGEVITRIIQKDMATMPFTIADEFELMKYCFLRVF